MKIPHFSDDWIEEWCDDNGWTDLFRERRDHYWAFPPGAVMPEPIPTGTMRSIKANKGLCAEEKRLIAMATAVSSLAIALTYILASPMPVVFAFAFDAMAAALLEVEDL
jgi:hypothetical protein